MDNYWFRYVTDYNPEEIAQAITEQLITTRNGKLHLDIYDQPRTCPTVIFMHGTAVYSKFYAEFLYSLYKEGIRVVAMDLPGHGQSEGIRGHFTVGQLVDSVSEVATFVLDTYGEEVAVMGSSLGGIVSLYAAAKDNRFKTAICHNFAILTEDVASTLLKLPWTMKVLSYFLPVTVRLFPRLKLSVFNYLDKDKLAGSPRSRELIELLLQDPLVAGKYSLTSLHSQMTERLHKKLEDIETPVLLMNGENDGLFTLDYVSNIFQRLECRKKMEILPGGDHFILHEQREECVKRVAAWLKEILALDTPRQA